MKSDYDKVVDKIRKLLRLAKDKGATEEESMAALVRARSLMLKHDIESVDEETAPGVVTKRYFKESWTDNWHSLVGMGVAILHNCRHATDQRGSHVFIGRPHNTEVAEESFAFIVNQIYGLLEEAVELRRALFTKLAAGAQNAISRAEYLDKAKTDIAEDFLAACSMRVYRRMLEIKAEEKGIIVRHKALLVLEDDVKDEIDAVVDAMNGKVNTAVVRATGVGAHAGGIAGDQVHIQMVIK